MTMLNTKKLKAIRKMNIKNESIECLRYIVVANNRHCMLDTIIPSLIMLTVFRSGS